jgi:hypothetical protein
MLHDNAIVSAVSAVALGGCLGWVLQTGRFCLNSAFRDVIFMKDMTMFRAYLLAVVVAIVGANFLEEMRLLRQATRACVYCHKIPQMIDMLRYSL